MEKNSTNEKWKFAASQIEKRKLEGKETEILINGTLVPSKKLKKEMARYAGDKSATLEESGMFYFLTVMMEAWADPRLQSPKLAFRAESLFALLSQKLLAAWST